MPQLVTVIGFGWERVKCGLFSKLTLKDIGYISHGGSTKIYKLQLDYFKLRQHVCRFQCIMIPLSCNLGDLRHAQCGCD